MLVLMALAPCSAALAFNQPSSQYAIQYQISSLNDPNGYCTFLQAGQTGTGVATLHGLGMTWTYTTFQNVQSPPYGINTTTCSISVLPPAAAFTGSPPSAPAPGTSTCLSSAPGSQTVAFVFTNNAAGPYPSSTTVTSVPTPGTDDQLRFDYVNAAVTLNGATLCHINGATVLLRD